VAWCVIADKGHPRASFCTSLDGTHCNTLHRTSTHFLAFFRTLVHLYVSYVAWRFIAYEGHPRVSFCTSLDATHCNTQHRTTTNCIALQHIASHTSQCWSVTSSVLLMMSAFFIFFRTWRIRMWHDSFVRDMIYSYVAWFIHMCHDSFICDMTHSCMTWLIQILHDSFACDMTHPRVTWHMTHPNITHYTYAWLMTHLCVTWCCITDERHPRNLLYVSWCNTLQHTASHCNTLHHTATHCNIWVASWFFLCTSLIHPWLIHIWHVSIRESSHTRMSYIIFIRDMTPSHVTSLRHT